MSSQTSQEFQPLPEKLWFRVDVEYRASTSILLEGIIGTLKCCILYSNPSPGFVLVPELLIVTHSEIMSETWKEENCLADFWSKISKQSKEDFSKPFSTISTDIQQGHEVINTEFSSKRLRCTSKLVWQTSSCINANSPGARDQKSCYIEYLFCLTPPLIYLHTR